MYRWKYQALEDFKTAQLVLICTQVLSDVLTRKVYDHATSDHFEFAFFVRTIKTILNGPKLYIRQILVRTKSAYSKKINHVVINFGEKISGSKLRLYAYGVT